MAERSAPFGAHYFFLVPAVKMIEYAAPAVKAMIPSCPAKRKYQLDTVPGKRYASAIRGVFPDKIQSKKHNRRW
jgi:hypothetical protein